MEWSRQGCGCLTNLLSDPNRDSQFSPGSVCPLGSGIPGWLKESLLALTSLGRTSAPRLRPIARLQERATSAQVWGNSGRAGWTYVYSTEWEADHLGFCLLYWGIRWKEGGSPKSFSIRIPSLSYSSVCTLGHQQHRGRTRGPGPWDLYSLGVFCLSRSMTTG